MADIERVESRHFALHEIIVKDRLRGVSEAGVSAVLSSLEEVKQIASPIWVRKLKDTYVLLDGAHRLEAAKRHGLATVPGLAWRCNDDQARLLEIDGNLAGAELDALDTAVFLAERKRVYESMHPETKAATGAALVNKRWNTADTMSVVSFAAATAQKFGMSERHVRRLIAAGERLDPRDRQMLRGAPRPVTLQDLQAISKIGSATERYHVVEALAAGQATSAAKARASFNAQPVPPKDPVEEAFQALLSKWTRAPAAARKRFVEEAFDEISDLFADEYERRHR